jgi:triosephosphate isomerase
MRRKLAAGNWKMNGLKADLDQLETLISGHTSSDTDILICPPATLVAKAAALASGSPVQIGGQDCHPMQAGAHTGDISATMLKDAGASFVITGHSERREDHDERNDDIRAKTQAGWAAGLTVVLCIGESLSQREADNTLDILAGQLSGSIPDGATADNLVLAYEPIWAIGTGLIPTLDQITEVHDFLRARMTRRFGDDIGSGIRLLYGGSVKPDNAAQIFSVANVDGALVGGASLKAADFSPIIKALEAS